MDMADAATSPCATSAAYEVCAAADPNIAPRLLALFAQRDLIPDMVQMRRLGDELAIVIGQSSVAEQTARIMAEKMRAIVTVRSVELAFRLPRGPILDGAHRA